MTVEVDQVVLDNLKVKLQKLKKEVNTKKTMTALARMARSIIYKRTKTGEGVSSSNEIQPKNVKLKALSKKYKDKLKRDPPNPIGKFYSTNRSNLTATGQMLESIIFKANSASFILEIADTVRNDEDSENGLTNKDLAVYVTENGRDFFALTDSETRIIIKLYEDIVRAKIKVLNL
jgi:DNA-binding protein H-NS